MDKIIKISQSLIKSVDDYINERECGLKIKAHAIDGLDSEPSDVQRKGNWFEYQATGALPRNGKIPEPDRKRDGSLKVDYERLQLQVEHFKAAIKHYGIEIMESGVIWNVDGMSGTLDILARSTKDIEVADEYGEPKIIKAGTIIIIDIKTSGLLENKWDDMGWHIDRLADKDKLMVQPVHYKLMARKKYGDDLPFFFFIHSNTNEIERKIIHINVEESAFDYHEQRVDNTRKFIELEKEWKPLPSVKRCYECSLKTYCEHRMDVPGILSVTVS